MPLIADSTRSWSAEFDTLRREKLFRSPPTDYTPHPALAEAFEPHIDSFNAVFEDGGLLNLGINDIGIKSILDGHPELSASTDNRNQLDIRIRDFFLDKSVLPSTNKFSTQNRQVFPAECRERHATYKGVFRVRLEFRVNDGDWHESVRELGRLPLMLRSSRCHLQACSPAKLVEHKEEAEEFGGYFIVNGLEKLIRLLIVTKRNHALAIVRPSFKNRGPTFTEFGIQVRSVRPDQSSQSNYLQYLNDGNVMFRFSWRKNEYLVPVVMILKALIETNDREIFESLIDSTDEAQLKSQQFAIDRIEMLLRSYKMYQMQGQSKTRAYLGSKFRPVLGLVATMSNEEVGTNFLRKVVLPHLGSVDVTEAQDKDKFNMLLFMLKKLYALVGGECAADNPDAVSNQEVLLGSFLYGMIIKERLEEYLNTIRTTAVEWCRTSSWRNTFANQDFFQQLPGKILGKVNGDIGQMLQYFLSTGNLSSPTGLDLQQANGFTVVAEKLNFYRFLSHFRMVHRGSFFAELKTTAVRKLLPESWGFLCPVHTPDGAPCGLLNHMAHKCKISTRSSNTSGLPALLAALGVIDSAHDLSEISIVVQLDGKVLGFCLAKQAAAIVTSLRRIKVHDSPQVPKDLEIGLIPTSKGGQYPGIYMSSHPARFYRPVKHLSTGQLDYVGPFEQPYMAIACTPLEIDSTTDTHVEYGPTNILSVVANMTPFSDYNQSPRNMYQCQMGKQTMGTPGTALKYRTDNKTYRLQTPQTPAVRPSLHNTYGLDNFPSGTNAIVAVISYTGYDMDDAMIINRAAHDRGFAHGTIYKTKTVRLDEGDAKKTHSMRTTEKLFGFSPRAPVRLDWRRTLDDDGLPRIGTQLNEGDVLAASHAVSYDASTKTLVASANNATELHRYKDAETAYVEDVRLHGSEDGGAPLTSISIKLRIPRSPIIGDKFSSRHGQKGVCSHKWPIQDMPFSESGMVPDIIINPHAFPSRMTIGMFIESLAGKSGALHGISQDSTPFQFEDKPGNRAVEYFGEQLRAAGYNYHGNEPMYSGVAGTELAADIYIGVVYYQRLRHMVNDKFQVRTTGPVTSTTGQPVQGRSKGGGIRVGEMERDALIAHGCAYLLQDRLMNCSDYTKSWVCRRCGGFLGTQPTVGGYGVKRRGTGVVRCRVCARKVDEIREGSVIRKSDTWEDGEGTRWIGGEDTTVVAVPGVLRYLDVELAAMGVRLKFNIAP